MEEGDERREEELRQIALIEQSVKRQSEVMGNAMAEALAPMMGGMQLLGDEARAWDQHAYTFASAMLHVSKPTTAEERNRLRDLAIEHADKLLDARRQRFSEKAFAERLRASLPSAKGLCNEPILRSDGTDTGARCTRNAGHEGVVHY